MKLYRIAEMLHESRIGQGGYSGLVLGRTGTPFLGITARLDDVRVGIDLMIPVAQLIVVVVQTFCSLVKVALCVSVRGDNLKKLFCFIY